MIRKLGWVLFAVAVGGCSTADPKPATHGVTSAAEKAVFATPHIGPELSARVGVPMHALAAELPTRALGEVRLSVDGRTAHVSMIPNGAAVSSATRADRAGMTVFEGAALDADRVLSAGADVLEELWVLRSPAAPNDFRVLIDSELRAQLHGARIQLLDANDRVVLSTTDVVAEDARGHRRTATLKRISDHEIAVHVDVADLEYPIVVDPAWFPTTPMNTTTTASPAFRLASGRVLVVAGEYYDQPTATWTNTGAVNVSQGDGYHNDPPSAAALLADGTVVNMGSFSVNADRYNPATNAWTLVSPAPRNSYYAVAAFPATAPHPAGAIAACDGGFSAKDTSSDVMYLGGGFGAAANMNVARWYCNAITMPNGKVLVVGAGAASGEVYDPATNTWKLTGAMSATRSYPLLAVLSTGKVLAAGGYGGDASAEVYDPATNTWTPTGSMSANRWATFPVTNALGKVLFVGGAGPSGATNTVEMYDPATGTFTKYPPLLVYRKWPSVALMSNGQVLAAGGWRTDSGSTTSILLATAETYGELNGSLCSNANECVSGNCVDGVCCSTASCSAGAYCNTPGKVGVCSKPLGVTCTTAAECASGQCIDGVCCATACPAQCAACDVPGHAGTCFPVTGAPHGSRTACAAGTDPACGAACDGTTTTSCKFPGATVSCGKASCTGHVATSVSTCHGDGTCTDASVSCGAYACGDTACKTTCTSAADCSTGFACVSGSCSPAVGLGSACSSDDDCATHFCTDGVCCGVRSCAFGQSCALGDPKGTCATKLGTACKMDAECAKGTDGNGHCVDGVCCNTACTGQCEACDVTGSFGTCSATVHAPHGMRTACDDGGTDACKAAECDGTDTTKCAGFVNGTAKQCAPSHCDKDTFTGPATCDGKGACEMVASTKCAPYVCDNAGCFTSCATDAQCATGNGCVGGKCQAIIARCSGDGESSIGTDGTTTACAPFRCSSAGTCGTTCALSTDCAGGYVCDTASSTCVAAPTDSGGGCAVSSSGSSGSGGASTIVGLLAVGLLLGGVVRRKAH